MIQPVEGGFVISSHDMWLPGVYADERAARYAFQFSNEHLSRLNATRGIGDVYRPITSDDLRAFRALTSRNT